MTISRLRANHETHCRGWQAQRDEQRGRVLARWLEQAEHHRRIHTCAVCLEEWGLAVARKLIASEFRVRNVFARSLSQWSLGVDAARRESHRRDARRRFKARLKAVTGFSLPESNTDVRLVRSFGGWRVQATEKSRLRRKLCWLIRSRSKQLLRQAWWQWLRNATHTDQFYEVLELQQYTVH
jgi:hypothetical protein